VNIIETSENSLTIARRRQRHVTVDGIEKRRHLGDRFNNMTITIEDANRVCHVTFLQDFFVSAKDNFLAQTDGDKKERRSLLGSRNSRRKRAAYCFLNLNLSASRR
jgi:hypothetical protein